MKNRGIVRVLMTLASLASGCRDQTSEQPVAETPIDPEEVSLVEAPESVPQAEIPPAPFVLSDQEHLLSQRSLKDQSFPSLEEFLSSSAGAALAKDAGLTISLNPEKTELVLSQNLALAFPRMGNSKPLVIKTAGHQLTLVGQSLRNLDINTSAPDRKAGHLIIYALEEVSGVFDLSGADGVAGEDGLCPPDFEDCVRAPGQSFPQTKLDTHIERKKEEHVDHHVSSYADRLGFMDFVDVPPSITNPNCRADPSPWSRKLEERFEGHVVIKKTVPTVNWKGSLKGRDGWVSPGKVGQPGQDAGQLVVRTLPGAKIEIIHKRKGGKGGSAGRPGIVRAAPAPFAGHLTAETQVALEASNAKKVYKYQLHYRTREVTGYCGTRGGTCCHSAFAHGEQTQGPLNPVLYWNESKDFLPPKTIPGQTPSLPESKHGSNGQDGAFEQSSIEDLESVFFGKSEVPLEILMDTESSL